MYHTAKIKKKQFDDVPLSLHYSSTSVQTCTAVTGSTKRGFTVDCAFLSRLQTRTEIS